MQSEPSSRDDVCACGHRRSRHLGPEGLGGELCLDCSDDSERSWRHAFRAEPVIINNRCKCRHDRFRHCFGKVDGACSKPSCDCEAYVPVTVETVELPEPDGPEYTSCDACGHIEPEHASTTGSCLECACLAWRHALDLAPPQPERRPPLTVAYSVVGGHAYEVSIPGDASVTAEDGALIIKHPSAEILAITRVAPMEG